MHILLLYFYFFFGSDVENNYGTDTHCAARRVPTSITSRSCFIVGGAVVAS